MHEEYVDVEIERLKAKKVELTSRINLTTDFDEKEDLHREVARIQEQIDILEKFKNS